MNDIALYGTSGAVMAYLIIKEVFQYIGQKKNGNGKNGKIDPADFKERIELNTALKALIESNNKLMHIHEGADNKKIADQIQDIWYDRKAYQRTIEKLYTSVDNLTLSVNKLMEKIPHEKNSRS